MEYKRKKPKSLIKILNSYIFTHFIHEHYSLREMSFKVCQAHDTQQDFGSLVKNKREEYNETLASMEDNFPKRGEAQSAVCEIRKSAKEVWAS